MKYIITSICILFGLVSYEQSTYQIFEEGQKFKRERKVSAAINKFKEVVQKDTNFIDAYYELAWCYNDTKEYNKALLSLAKIRLKYNHIAKFNFEEGYAYYKLNNSDSSIACFLRCIKIKNDYVSAYEYLGHNYYDLNKSEEALANYKAFYEKSIARNSSFVPTYLYWYRRGFTENALKLYEDAILSLTKALDSNKTNINTYLELGYAHTKLKNNLMALSYFKQAISIDRYSHIPYNGIAEVFRDNYKNIDSAIYWYNQTLKIKPAERKANFGLGYCYNSKNDYSKAIPYLETAIREEPTYTAAYVEYGYSKFKLGYNDDALKYFATAIRLNPKNENARFYAGLVYVAQKNKEKAQQMANELKLLNSKNASSLQDRVNKM